MVILSQLFKRNPGIKLVIMSLVFNIDGAYTEIQLILDSRVKV